MAKKAVLSVFILVLLYTRFTGLSWGLPYPFHPDERNMAVAIQELRCENAADFQNCLNPHFFAYGQVPLYLAYGGITLFHLALGISANITFEEATIALRIISVIASLATAWMLFRLAAMLTTKKYGPWIAVIAFLFSPYGIQFAHFGTTESLLMFLYTTIAYLTFRLMAHPADRKTIAFLSLCLGLSVGIKISSVIFLVVPFLALSALFARHRKNRLAIVHTGILVIAMTALFSVLFSPQTLISWKEFMGSFGYESSVGTGSYLAFYTRQFIGTIPVLFQAEKVFPYALGAVSFGLFLLGFAVLPWKDRRMNFLRAFILVYLLPTAFLFAKWTRFMAPVFPLMTLVEALIVLQLLESRRWLAILAGAVFLVSLLPGIAYLSVYNSPDVRFTASDWIYSHIPAQAKILSETANVIDIPIPPPDYKKTPPIYQYVSFDFYHVDENPQLQAQLEQYAKTADYIFVPSRRVFMDHPAAEFPQLQSYYHALFTGKLGYARVARLTSYPKISLFGRTLIEFPDEGAEETWTVFDHPVIRIYKKTGNAARQDFSNYGHMDYAIGGKNYRLLIADSPQKWEEGLMWVRTKEDAGGYDGMIFLFPTREIQSFWNKNTVTDLDLYWIDNQQIVGKSFLPSIETSKQTVTVTSPKEADKVIEIIR